MARCHDPVANKVNRLRHVSLVVAFLAVLVPACTPKPARSETLLVLAASSTRDAVAELARAYRESGGDSLVLAFGSSGDHVSQVLAGAPADILISADSVTLDRLSHIVPSGDRRTFAFGKLALVARCAYDAKPADPVCRAPLPGELATSHVRTIAIANPQLAPYGAASRQVLERLQLWDVVRDKVVFASTIAQAEQYVATGNADVGFVALSLLMDAPHRAYTIVDSTLYEMLPQQLAVLPNGNTERARLFLHFMQGDSAREILERYGYSVPSAPGAN